MNNPTQKKKNNPSTTQQNTNLKPYITVPYYKGLSESVKKKCSNYGVHVYFWGGTTIKNLLMAQKDKDPMLKKSEVIYSYKCMQVAWVQFPLPSPPWPPTAGGDAEHVSLNHWLAPPYPGVKLGLAKT